MSATYFYAKNLVWGNYDIDGKGHIDELGNPILLQDVLSGVFPDFPPTISHIDGGVNIIFPSQLSADDYSLLTATVFSYQNYLPTKIESIHRNWETLYTDYKQARCALQHIVTDSGFANMTPVEKKIASMWFVVPMEQRITVHTVAQQVEFGKAFHDNSVIARRNRANAATAAMYNYLTKADSFEVVDDIVNTYNLIGKYITYGREGTIEDGTDGLFDYFESRDGSMFSGVGLASKSFTPIGVTLPQLVNAAMRIFKSGIY